MSNPSSSPRLMVPVHDLDHVLGSPSARVTLVEYGDYECPNCLRAFPMVQDLQHAMGHRLRFVFRHFPLVDRHPYALRAAEAAEAAAAQGCFWEMHAHLFNHQRALDDRSLMRYARDLGLDRARFERDLKEGRHRARIEADIESGKQSGVRGTPTFFINDLRYDDSPDFETMLMRLELAHRSAHPS